MFVLVTKSEPDTVTQLVPSPTANELVCVCRSQPALVGHDRLNVLPETLTCIVRATD